MPTPVELFARGLHLYEAGQWERAQDTLRHVLSLAPRHGGALHLLGTMAFHVGEHAEAAEFFRKAAVADPGNAFFQSSLGAAYQALGKLTEARTQHEQALRLSPNDALVLNNLGITLASLGEAEQAVAVFRRALALTPADPEILTNLAAALRALGKLNEATDCCQRALQLRPGFAEAYHNLGNVLLDQDQPDEALRHFDLALQCAPGFAQAHLSRGRALQATAQIDPAVLACRQALQINPACLEAYLRLGDVLLALNQSAEAQAVYEQALRVRPDSSEVYNGLGNAYFAQGELDQAESCYGSALCRTFFLAFRVCDSYTHLDRSPATNQEKRQFSRRGERRSGTEPARYREERAIMYRIRATRFSACAVLVFLALTAPVKAEVIILFNTGVADNGTLLPAGAVDPHYQLIFSSDPRYPGPDARVPSPIDTAWLPNGPDSQWIAPRPEYPSVQGGIYIYQTTFDLTGLDPYTAVIVGQWATDNDAEIFLNGVSTGIITPFVGFTQFYPFTIDSGFVEGVNTLEFVVNNGPATASGIRVELSGEADVIP